MIRDRGTPRARVASTNGSPTTSLIACACSRSSIAASGSAIAAAGTTRWRSRSMNPPPSGTVADRIPAIGSHPVRAATKTRNKEVNSGGIDSRTTEAARMTFVSAPPRPLPVSTPSGRPMSVAQTSAVIASTAVLAARSGIRSRTGRSYSMEWPKSSRTAAASQSRYWAPIDLLRPYRARSCSIVCRPARVPIDWVTKSPGASRASISAADDTAITRNRANASRRAR